MKGWKYATLGGSIVPKKIQDAIELANIQISSYFGDQIVKEYISKTAVNAGNW